MDINKITLSFSQWIVRHNKIKCIPIDSHLKKSYLCLFRMNQSVGILKGHELLSLARRLLHISADKTNE